MSTDRTRLLWAFVWAFWIKSSILVKQNICAGKWARRGVTEAWVTFTSVIHLTVIPAVGIDCRRRCHSFQCWSVILLRLCAAPSASPPLALLDLSKTAIHNSSLYLLHGENNYFYTLITENKNYGTKNDTNNSYNPPRHFLKLSIKKSHKVINSRSTTQLFVCITFNIVSTHYYGR